MSTQTKIAIHPVGALHDLQIAYRCVTKLHRWDQARGYLGRIPSTIMRHVRDRDWRALKNTFNGYLAEIDYPCEDLKFRTCGHGWTKRRAARRLGEYLARDNA